MPQLPKNFTKLTNEPKWDANKYLNLQKPSKIIYLSDIGYTEDEIKLCPSRVASTSPFQILNEGGVKILYKILNQELVSYRLEGKNGRFPSVLRGGVYLSQFIEDFCNCSVIAGFLEEAFECKIKPHILPNMLGHTNFAPKELSLAVDSWHTDSVQLDYVLMVTDPTNLKGGEFEFFNCPKDRAKSILENKTPRSEYENLINKANFTKAGQAIFMQGNMIMHRAAPLQEVAERITVVNSYQSKDQEKYPDTASFETIKPADRNDIACTEWAKSKMILTKSKIDLLLENMEYTDDIQELVAKLNGSILEIQKGIYDLENTKEGKLISL